MILIVGATGSLGRRVARRLLMEGKPVRAMTRGLNRADPLRELGAEVIQGDLRDRASLTRACRGVEKVLAAAHAFPGEGSNNPQTVDDAGNRHLIDAAKEAGVKHFVFMSILGAAPHHGVDLFRIKYRIEEYLRVSGMSYTILRSAAFMETWGAKIGMPILRGETTRILGRGENPINFVSADDVAQTALIALEGERTPNETIKIAGPENLTLNQVAGIFEEVTGRPAAKCHAPLPEHWITVDLLHLVNSAMSREMAAAIHMDTADLTFPMGSDRDGHRACLTRMEQVARTMQADMAGFGFAPGIDKQTGRHLSDGSIRPVIQQVPQI